MTCRTPAILTLFCALAAFVAGAQADDSTPRLGGSLETRQAWLSGTGEHALAQYRGELQADWKTAGGLSARARISATGTSRLDVGRDERAEIDELFVTLPVRNCLLRAGVQTVVWGQADRIQVVDVLHPLDLSESYFGGWERKRLPLAMLDADCSFANGGGVQLLVIPQTRFNRRPTSGGRFAVERPEGVAAAAGLSVASAADPSAGRVGDWSVGLQWYGRLGPLDLALYGFRGWETDRVLGRGDAGGLVRAADRLSMLGASFAMPAGSVVLRGEMAVRDGVTQFRPAAGGLPAQPTPFLQWVLLFRKPAAGELPTLVQAREVSVLLGVDQVAGPWTLSAQWFMRRGEEAMLETGSRIQRVLTLAVRRPALADRLTVGVLAAFDLVNSSRVFSVEAGYELGHDWQLHLSAERFSGDRAGFGHFDAQSRVLAQLRYSF